MHVTRCTFVRARILTRRLQNKLTFALRKDCLWKKKYCRTRTAVPGHCCPQLAVLFEFLSNQNISTFGAVYLVHVFRSTLFFHLSLFISQLLLLLIVKKGTVCSILVPNTSISIIGAVY